MLRFSPIGITWSSQLGKHMNYIGFLFIMTHLFLEQMSCTNDFNAIFLFENLDFQAILGFVRSEQLLLLFFN